jgi:hypothetical protein
VAHSAKDVRMGKIHSAIGASSAHRWMECPGSVRLTADLPATTSEAAEEGTAAHTLAELCLRNDEHPSQYLGDTIEGYEVTEEMVQAVEMFVTYVRRRKEEEQFDLMVEVQFSLSYLHPPVPMYGTADVVLHKRGKLLVVDFKYGRRPVEVQHNRQLMYYLLGAASVVAEPGTESEMVIVQPRALHPDGPIRSAQVSSAELRAFEAELLAAARRTQEPDAPLVPGEHCRWCRAKPICPALHSKALEVAQTEFDDLDAPPSPLPPPERLPDEVILKVLEWRQTLKTWLGAVEDYVSHRVAADPTAFGGQYKLVARRAVRRWVDPEAVEMWAESQGIPEDDLFVRKLKSPAQLEKTVRGEARKELQKFTEKHSSGTVLVPHYDIRPAIVRGSEFAALPPADPEESE